MIIVLAQLAFVGGIVALIIAFLFVHRPWEKPMLTPLDGGMTQKMRAKDPLLYEQIGMMPIGDAWRHWKSVYPEDFPQGGLTPYGPSAIVLDGWDGPELRRAK